MTIAAVMAVMTPVRRPAIRPRLHADLRVDRNVGAHTDFQRVRVCGGFSENKGCEDDYDPAGRREMLFEHDNLPRLKKVYCEQFSWAQHECKMNSPNFSR